MENPLKLEAPWPMVKEWLKEVEYTLTDDDLEYEPGQEDELLERLSAKMGRDKDAVRQWIESVSYNRGIAG